MGNDPVNNVDPDGGSIGSWVRLFLQALNLVRPATPAVGQFSGVAQATSLSGSTAAGTSGGGSGTGGGLLNSLGNAAASALGQWVANKLLPMPSGPDAKNLQPTSQESIHSIFLQASYIPDGDEGFDDGGGEDGTLKLTIESGGYNIHRGGLDPNKKNGIDITFKVTGAKGAVGIQIIQTVQVSNDQKITTQEAKADDVWRSPDGSKLGFVDPGEGLFYVDPKYMKAMQSKGDYLFDSKKGEGKIRFIDAADFMNDISIAYRSMTFTTYIVTVGTDGKLIVAGMIKFTFLSNGSTITTPTGQPKVLNGTFNSVDLSIINTNPSAKKQFK